MDKTWINSIITKTIRIGLADQKDENSNFKFMKRLQDVIYFLLLRQKSCSPFFSPKNTADTSFIQLGMKL